MKFRILALLGLVLHVLGSPLQPIDPNQPVVNSFRPIVVTPGAAFIAGFDPILSAFQRSPFAFTYAKGYQSILTPGVAIPDQCFERSTSSTSLELSSDIITKTSQLKSEKDYGVSANAKYKSFFGGGSSEKKLLSEIMTKSKSKLVRTAARNRISQIYLNEINLCDDFARRIQRMADTVQYFNITEDGDARQYLYQEVNQLLADYGPHFIDQVELGGILSIYKTFREDSSSTMSSTQIKKSASAGFSSFIKLGGTFSSSKDKKDTFDEATEDLVIRTAGGIPWGEDTLYSEWASSLPLRPEVVSYNFRSITDLITGDYFRHIPFSTLYQIREAFEKEVNEYFETNDVHGCTDINSPNFKWFATTEDGSCELVDDNMHWGGFFVESSCAEFDQVNHMTQDHSCPTPFEPVVLVEHSLVKSGTYYTKKCKRSWFHKKCKKEEHTEYTPCPQKITGCVDFSDLSKRDVSHGFYFGGIYTPTINNMMTGMRSCPEGFQDEILVALHENGDALHICQMDYQSSNGIPSMAYKMGGIYNCQNPNPATGRFSCPAGSMKHPIGSYDGCDWFYCVFEMQMSHKYTYYPPNFDRRLEFPVELFEELDAMKRKLKMLNLTNDTDNMPLSEILIAINETDNLPLGEIDGSLMEEIISNAEERQKARHEISGGGIAGLAIGMVAVAVISAIGAVAASRKCMVRAEQASLIGK